LTTTTDNGWISARGGKWHRATNPEPTFMKDETAACGRTFRPLNVTWHGDEPPTTPTHLCRDCLKATGAAA
jgi:hypothetical protein